MRPLTGDGMNFKHFFNGTQLFNHRPIPARLINGYPNERRYVKAELFGIQDGMVSLDQVAFSQLTHAIANTRDAQAHFIRDFDSLDPA